jgi:hypothetical protein
MTKKNKWPLIFVVLMLAGAIFVRDRFYQRGIRAVVAFSASYDRFDKAISGLSSSMTDDSESQARSALAELRAKAAFRVSSLIKNDGELMNLAREVADLSARELASLGAYRKASRVKNAALDELATESGDLGGKRKEAFARFRGLCGSQD